MMFRLATKNGDLKRIKELIEVKGLVDHHVFHCSLFEGGLIEAVKNNHIDIVKYLVEKKTDIHAVGDSALIFAIDKDHHDTIKFLLKEGAYLFKVIESMYYEKKKDDIKIIKYLMENGADIHALNNEALQVAIKNNQEKIVKYLLQEGANIKVLSEENQIKYKKYSIIKLMIYLLDFHYKRETELSKNEIADCNILSIVFSFH